jgi:hypothetical protein
MQEISAGPPSAVLYGHSFPPCTFPVFRSPSTLSRCRCLCVGFVKFPNLFRFFLCSVLCFHVCKTTQLSSFTLTRNTCHPNFLPPNHLVPRVAYYILPSPLHHQSWRQYMFIHQHPYCTYTRWRNLRGSYLCTPNIILNASRVFRLQPDRYSKQ